MELLACAYRLTHPRKRGKIKSSFANLLLCHVLFIWSRKIKIKEYCHRKEHIQNNLENKMNVWVSFIYLFIYNFLFIWLLILNKVWCEILYIQFVTSIGHNCSFVYYIYVNKLCFISINMSMNYFNNKLIFVFRYKIIYSFL